jgi:hypothetical protein
MGVSPTHTGWYRDHANGRLYLYYQGTAVGYIDANGLFVGTADQLQVGGVIVPQAITVQSGIIDSTYDADRFIWTADAAYQVTKVEVIASAIENSSATTTLMVEKVPSGTAIGSGTDILAAALNLKTGVTANTKAAPALHATAANLQLAAGDSLALDFTNALTEFVGCVTITLKRI